MEQDGTRAEEAAPQFADSDADAPRTWNIYRKMLYIQQHLKVGKERGKGHTPDSKVKYKYRNAQDILEKAKPLMAYTGTVVNVHVWPEMIGVGVPVEDRMIGKDNSGNEIFDRICAPRFVARARASLIDIAAGERIDAESFAEVDHRRSGQTEPEKLCGSADSYASKYALAHLFGLDDGKDADGEGDNSGSGNEASPF